VKGSGEYNQKTSYFMYEDKIIKPLRWLKKGVRGIRK
jgi:hypothetical protein